jgi:hypothetical protein
MALLVADVKAHYARANGFEAVPPVETELTAAESSRHGAPVTLIRGGEERDLAESDTDLSFGLSLSKEAPFSRKRRLHGEASRCAVLHTAAAQP